MFPEGDISNTIKTRRAIRTKPRSISIAGFCTLLLFFLASLRPSLALKTPFVHRHLHPNHKTLSFLSFGTSKRTPTRRRTRKGMMIESATAMDSLSSPSVISDMTTNGNSAAHVVDAVDAAATADTTSTATLAAQCLGYVVGAGSVLLYTPIALRVWRQKSAKGLAVETWWLKLSSYTCSDVYCFTRGYPLSTYVETVIIAVEAAVILVLVEFFQSGRALFWKLPSSKTTQQQLLPSPNRFTFGVLLYLLITTWGLTVAPPQVIAAGQLGAAALNTAALVPQFLLNYKGQTKGDYSPTTATLAATGCLIRLFTVAQLADSDPVLLFSFGVAFILNTALLLQILYYGTAVEGLSLTQVFSSDLGKQNDSSKCRESIEQIPTETNKSELERKQVLPLIRRSSSSLSRHS
mmetsp:Transcript_10873/g.20049  ORF Transcript_10873/g.20049 Transcript_10873/m.20049 type:complete len:407 (-) Transcript_10873:407-1627(-)